MPQPTHEVVPYSVYANALRDADLRFAEERDRRYAEVNIEREKALKIKDTADRDADERDREARSYREQQADAWRDKSLSESGVYATNESVGRAINSLRDDLKPFMEFVNSMQGQAKGSQMTMASIYALIAAVGVVAAIFGYFL